MNPINLRPAIKLFASRPLTSFFLAALMVCVGIAFVSGLVPTSANRPYFPGHPWVMASLCWSVAVFLLYCARAGMSGNRLQEKK